MPEGLDNQTIFDRSIGEVADDAPSRTERPVLIVFDERDVHRRHPLDKHEIVIGRDVLADITLPDQCCSRRHVALCCDNFDKSDEPPNVRLVDLGSTNGTYVNGVRITERVLEDRDKSMMGSTVFGFFLRDESELAADQRLIHMANVDALTTLSNRAVFDREIAEAFNQAGRLERALSLVLFDIDHFKRFNDTYGHQTGDLVLREIGRLVQQNIRGGDIAARYGGEEFAIILPATSLQGAVIQAERLRASVRHHTFDKDGNELTLTVSVGLSNYADGFENVEKFIEAADKALYKAKSDGRGRVCWMRNGQLGANDATMPLVLYSPLKDNGSDQDEAIADHPIADQAIDASAS